MPELLLIPPNRAWGREVMACRQEHLDHDDDRLIHGAGFLEEYDRYDQWLNHVFEQKSLVTARPGLVPASTFLAVRPGEGRLVGFLDIRHWLNDFLREYGGHIGYGVRPAERGRGQAREILRLGLELCPALGLTQILLAAMSDNRASLKVIEKSGGIFEKEQPHPFGGLVRLYCLKGLKTC